MAAVAAQFEVRVPPHDLDAEQSVLGAVLLDPVAITRVLDFLHPEDFYRENNKQIYRAAQNLFAEGEPIDNVTLSAELEKLGVLDRIGGRAHLALLQQSVPTAANVEHYGRIVKEKAYKRNLISAGGEISGLGYNDSLDADSSLNQAQSAIYAIATDRVGSDIIRLDRLLRPAMDRIDALMSSGKSIQGLATGFTDLDAITNGFKASDLVIIAGRPSMGKCLTSCTLIDDPLTGNRLTIEQAVQRRLGSVWGIAEDGAVRPAAVEDWVDSGVQECFRVRTRTGRSVEVTGHHPFMTVSGWQPLHDIVIGHRIAVPRQVPCFGTDDSLGLDQVRLLAYYIAEGGLTHTSPAFSNTDPVILEDFRGILAARYPEIRLRFDGRCTYFATQRPGWRGKADGHLGREIKRCRQAAGITQAELASRSRVCRATISLLESGRYLPKRDTLSRLRAALGEPELIPMSVYDQRNPIKVWLEDLGLWGKPADAKRFPDGVWRWDRERLATFLRCLMSCDGSIYPFGGRPRIEFAVASQGLAEDVQHALTRFGVVAKLWRKSVRCWRVEITDPLSVATYQREIGWIGAKAERFPDLPSDAGRRSNLGHLPVQVWAVLRTAAGDRGLTLAAVARSSGELMDARGSNLHTNRGLPQRRLRGYATVLSDPHLQRISHPDLYWDEVVSIEPIGRHQVYDLTVPEGSNFIAQDVLVHNTSFALNVALHAAIHQKIPVAIFSLEMSQEQLVERMLCEEARIDAMRMHRGLLGDAEFDRLSRALGPLGEAPIFIDESATMDELTLLMKARRAKMQENIGLIIIDYLQLMHGRHKGNDNNRVQEVSQISRALKGLARELKVPVIAISQLSRAPEQRPDKRPMLSDLRESGSIEQDSDMVMFVFRPEYYKPEEKPGRAEIIISKNRNGPTGTIELAFRKELTRFENLERKREPVS